MCLSVLVLVLMNGAPNLIQLSLEQLGVTLSNCLDPRFANGLWPMAWTWKVGHRKSAGSCRGTESAAHSGYNVAFLFAEDFVPITAVLLPARQNTKLNIWVGSWPCCRRTRV